MSKDELQLIEDLKSLKPFIDKLSKEENTNPPTTTENNNENTNPVNTDTNTETIPNTTN